ncbi:hypothetical protein TI39_contig635g00001 [Zymoseptoria brevis]|uniref:Uncharacterized protein n=1 Tax=Zymoseptoria brevis TaxID=1047168 RepID=A0A0F4GG22_9PEZI|nr:hypothetical protein TI39_contig635g00001 [Zymoseptoria brevis]
MSHGRLLVESDDLALALSPGHQDLALNTAFSVILRTFAAEFKDSGVTIHFEDFPQSTTMQFSSALASVGLITSTVFAAPGISNALLAKEAETVFSHLLSKGFDPEVIEQRRAELEQRGVDFKQAVEVAPFSKREPAGAPSIKQAPMLFAAAADAHAGVAKTVREHLTPAEKREERKRWKKRHKMTFYLRCGSIWASSTGQALRAFDPASMLWAKE